jgi:hypothetical protein
VCVGVCEASMPTTSSLEYRVRGSVSALGIRLRADITTIKFS